MSVVKILTEGLRDGGLSTPCTCLGLDLGHGPLHNADLLVRHSHTEIAAVVPI